MPLFMLVAFEGLSAGAPELLRTPQGVNVLPIWPGRREAFVQGRNAYRQQFPLTVSYALSVHKAQGITLYRVVLNLNHNHKEHSSRICYVAVSRAKTLQGIMFEHDAPEDGKFPETDHGDDWKSECLHQADLFTRAPEIRSSRMVTRMQDTETRLGQRMDGMRKKMLAMYVVYTECNCGSLHCPTTDTRVHHSNHNTHAQILNRNVDKPKSIITPPRNVDTNEETPNFHTTLESARELLREQRPSTGPQSSHMLAPSGLSSVKTQAFVIDEVSVTRAFRTCSCVDPGGTTDEDVWPKKRLRAFPSAC